MDGVVTIVKVHCDKVHFYYRYQTSLGPALKSQPSVFLYMKLYVKKYFMFNFREDCYLSDDNYCKWSYSYANINNNCSGFSSCVQKIS